MVYLLIFFKNILLSCLKLCLTVELPFCSWGKTMSEFVGPVSNLKKLAVMFA